MHTYHQSGTDLYIKNFTVDKKYKIKSVNGITIKIIKTENDNIILRTKYNMITLL